ncbi:MAG: hypothetical protein UT24_C0033G0002 [Candidatus Woesebacteria bacterium GW2011_GWB1_39_12]|uniref:Uncharacterized protein n=1 Tax=Candidatus Woesebacteria bacterium GW2011_GWB1_39_12 TaxID=1618574 RepID=A0A0G0M6J3_9BACT|nr:MAG: hypothetical protein UT24_C0033G0002 [Candidatus Woesebacteria bacterium GW2011_GWB1_39_12]
MITWHDNINNSTAIVDGFELRVFAVPHLKNWGWTVRPDKEGCPVGRGFHIKSRAVSKERAIRFLHRYQSKEKGKR